MQKSLINNNHLGVSTIILGILSIIVSALSIYFHKKIIAFNNEHVFQFVQVLNILSKIDIIIKPIGLIASIVCFFSKNTRKSISIIGICLNIFAITWILFYVYG